MLPCWISSVSIYYYLEFAESFVVQVRASRYMMGLNHTHKSKVMAIWICLTLPCLIFSVSIYYWPESDIRMKCYDHLNFSRVSAIQFRSSQYIMGLNHTPESKVMAVCIWQELSCSNSNLSIYYWPELEIRVKCYDHLNFLRASIVQFRASRYIMDLNHTPESKVIAVWISLALPCLI